MSQTDDHPLSKKEKFCYYCVAGTILSGAFYLFYHSLLLSVISLLISIPGQRFYKEYLREKRKKEISLQFRDMLHSLSASFHTSRQMQDALQESLHTLALLYGEESILGNEVRYVLRRMEESKDTEEDILLTFSLRCDDPDIESFVDVYLICRKTGGNLGKVVSKTAEVLVDKLDIQREIRKLTAQKRYESVIITAIPLLMLFFLQLTSPEYLQVLYDTAIGRILMSAALLATVFSYLWSLRITDIEV